MMSICYKIHIYKNDTHIIHARIYKCKIRGKIGKKVYKKNILYKNVCNVYQIGYKLLITKAKTVIQMCIFWEKMCINVYQIIKHLVL